MGASAQPTEKGTIVVVDDEPNIADLVGMYLEREGFRVLKSGSGAGGLEQIAAHRPRLVVLDIGLPDLDGIEVCKQLRRTSATPVIFLTARDSEVDRVVGLELGADDYLTKPFSFPVLVARVRSLLRRTAGRAPAPIGVGDLTIDPGEQRVWRGDDEIRLTTREFQVLEFFVRRAGQVLAKHEILAGVWDYDFDGDPNIVEVYVRRLRRKIDEPYDRTTITTLRGAGYRLDQ